MQRRGCRKSVWDYAPGVDVTKGEIFTDRYRCVTEKLKERFPNLQLIAITLRQSISARHFKWSGVLYDGKKLYVGPTYDITHIVDRVGAGDVFARWFNLYASA